MSKNPTVIRRWGIVFLVLGIIFLLLLIMAEAGGGRVSPTAFLIALACIIWGWRMYKTGQSVF